MGIQGMAYPGAALAEGMIGLQRIRVTVDIALDMRVSGVPTKVPLSPPRVCGWVSTFVKFRQTTRY